MVAVANKESRDKSRRVKRAAETRKEVGKPNGGLGYGWHKKGGEYVEDPEQADIVREIIARLDMGETVSGITTDLNNRGIPSATGKTWKPATVRGIALRESNIAKRCKFHATWPALVPDVAQWQRVVNRLGDPSRRTTKQVAHPGARQHLLSWGVGQCGECGGALRVTTNKQGISSYVCAARGKGGYHVSRRQDKVDEIVTEFIFQRLSSPDAINWLRADTDTAKETAQKAADLRHRLEMVDRDFYDFQLMDRERYVKTVQRFTPQLEAAEDEARRLLAASDTSLLAQVAGPQIREKWPTLKISQQTLVAETLFSAVVVKKAERKGGRFDPSCVQVIWHAAK